MASYRCFLALGIKHELATGPLKMQKATTPVNGELRSEVGGGGEVALSRSDFSGAASKQQLEHASLIIFPQHPAAPQRRNATGCTSVHLAGYAIVQRYTPVTIT